MTCEQAELRMGELLAAEISPAGRSELEQHLLDCADCREDFRLAREGYRLSWAEVPVPHDVIQGTLAALREPPALVRVFRWGTAAAAIISVAVLLISSSRSTPVVPPPAEPVAAACTMPQETVLATMQDAVVGALVCKDEDGRPVGELGLKSHEVSVEILDGIAKTTVEENFENHTDRRLEGSFNFPLPSDASISRLALEVNGKIEEGTCLERERARQVFESIVRKMQDPALLEWQPGGFFKCRVFPIEPRATKRVIVAYTQTLPCFQGKMSYVYPLASEKTRTHPPGEVRIHVTARFTGALTRIESTSHHLDVQRKDAHEASMSFRAANYRPNNDFVVTLEPQEEEVRVVCHKPDAEPGYFACFATPKSTEPRAPEKHTFVLDASASISAPRLEVAKRLVRAMIERAIPGDRFEVLAHSVEVESSGEVDLRAANTFMDRLQPIGGSDVLKALKAAGPGEIVYIGKGTPTFGETRTAAILEAMKGARIRTVAVGSDANLPLLEKLGGMMRIAPNDEVDKRVGEIAATLGSPVISELKVEGDNISDVVGVRDLFAGERLIVVGRYKAAGAAKVVLSGRGYRREVEVAFPEKEEANNPARRLWAQRKVADLLAKGESTKPEVTALGVKYQIMTPYTSFLVLESEQMWKDHQLQREVQKQDKVLGRGEEEQKRIYESQRHYELALQFNNRGDLEKAKGEAQKAVEAWGENTAARKLVNDINRITVGGRGETGARSVPEDARDDFRIRVEQAQIEITKHVRDGERYLSARMYEQAQREFENAEFKLENIPGKIPAMTELLPGVKDALIKTRNARILEDRRTDGEKRRMAEAEAVAGPRATIVELPSGRVGPGFSSQETVRAESETRVVQPRYVAPPAVYTAKVEPGITLNGSPLISPEAEEATRNWTLRRQLEAQLSRDANGKVLGSLNYDAQTNVFVVRDRPEVQERIKSIVEAADAAAGPRAQDESRQQLLQLREGGLSRPGFSSQESVRLESWDVRRNEFHTAGKGSPSDLSSTILRLPVTEEEKARDEYKRLVDFPEVDVAKTPEKLDTENSGKAARMNDLQARLDAANTLGTKYEADMQVFVRQMEVQLAQIQELTTKVDEHRAKLAKSLNEKSLAVGELQYARQRAEGLERELGELEEKHIEMARDKKHLEEKINALAQNGGNVNVAPKKALEGRVTAVAPEFGMVVLSLGKDDGVLVGDEFTVYRGGDFVAKIVIDRADRKWAAGKIVLKKGDPQVGDDVSNHIFISGPRSSSACEAAVPVDESKASLERIRAKMGLKE